MSKRVGKVKRYLQRVSIDISPERLWRKVGEMHGSDKDKNSPSLYFSIQVKVNGTRVSLVYTCTIRRVQDQVSSTFTMTPLMTDSWCDVQWPLWWAQACKCRVYAKNSCGTGLLYASLDRREQGHPVQSPVSWHIILFFVSGFALSERPLFRANLFILNKTRRKKSFEVRNNSRVIIGNGTIFSGLKDRKKITTVTREIFFHLKQVDGPKQQRESLRGTCTHRRCTHLWWRRRRRTLSFSTASERRSFNSHWFSLCGPEKQVYC